MTANGSQGLRGLQFGDLNQAVLSTEFPSQRKFCFTDRERHELCSFSSVAVRKGVGWDMQLPVCSVFMFEWTEGRFSNEQDYELISVPRNIGRTSSKSKAFEVLTQVNPRPTLPAKWATGFALQTRFCLPSSLLEPCLAVQLLGILACLTDQVGLGVSLFSR